MIPNVLTELRMRALDLSNVAVFFIRLNKQTVDLDIAACFQAELLKPSQGTVRLIPASRTRLGEEEEVAGRIQVRQCFVTDLSAGSQKRG